MAKLKRNHTNQGSSSGGMVKIGLFAIILAGLFWVFNQFSGEGGTFEEAIEQADDIFTQNPEEPKGPSIPSVSGSILPNSTTGEIVKHEFYALSYSEEHEQPEWVAYELTRENIQAPNVKRTNNFRSDPRVRKASASDRDYRGSGYSRGHMCPAGDMAFSERSMSESFYMSNMSPQIINFNGGIWRELEECVRDWAYKFKRVIVITGPVLTRNIREKIGGNEVSVPDEYYKVILDMDNPEIKAIGFLMPNELSTKPIEEYAVTVDEIEAITGLDFFSGLLEKDREEVLEADFELDLWPTKSDRYQKRVKNWNRR